MAALTIPTRPEDYIHDHHNLIDGYGWVFGLPSEGQVSSATCGALPFRNGSGYASPNCIRGEDWVFLDNWSYDRGQLVNINVVTSFNGVQGVQSIAPSIQQLSAMYANLSSLCAVYGQDFSVADQEVSYNNADSVVISGLQHNYTLVSQPPPLTGDVPLELQRLSNYFIDMPNLKCTITYGGHDKTASMTKDMYYYSAQDGQTPSETAGYLSSLDLRVTYVTNDPSKPIQFDAQFIGLFLLWGGDSNNQQWQQYVLKNLTGKVTVTQDLSSNFIYPAIIGGAGIANRVADVVGKDTRPTPPAGGNAWFGCQLQYLYAVVWPKYLQLA